MRSNTNGGETLLRCPYSFPRTRSTIRLLGIIRDVASPCLRRFVAPMSLIKSPGEIGRVFVTHPDLTFIRKTPVHSRWMPKRGVRCSSLDDVVCASGTVVFDGEWEWSVRSDVCPLAQRAVTRSPRATPRETEHTTTQALKGRHN